MQLKPKLFLALILVSGSALLISSFSNLPVDLTLLGAASVVLGLYLAVRFPEWFLIAAVFAPQWKAIWIFQSASRVVDLTLAMLLCLAVGLAWRTLLWFGRLGYGEIQSVFSRQLTQILAFLVFAAIVTLSYFYTSAPDYGGTKLMRFLLIGMILFVAPFFIIFTEEDFRHFCRIFIGFSVVTAIQLVSTLELRSQDADNDITRIGAGWLMGMAVLILLFYPIARNVRRQRALLIFLAPLFIAGLMASAARGPIVALSVAVLIGMVALLKEGRLRASTAVFVLAFLLAGMGGTYLALRQTDIGKYNAKAGELGLLLTQGSSSGSAGERLGFYRATLAAIPNQPLFGSGIGSWSTFYYGSDQRNYPHNLFLEIAFEEGLIGLAAFLALLALVGVSIFRMLGASRSHFLVLGLLVLYCVIVSLFSGDLDDNRVLWFWMGMTLSVCRLVELRVSALRATQKAARRTNARARYPSSDPTFSPRFASEKHLSRRKDRAWREKFVF